MLVSSIPQSSNGVIIDEISVQGENLETYFENLIGGRKNV